MKLYIRDMIAALWAWVSIWNISYEKIERRKRFMEDAINAERKNQWPYKIIMSAYNRRINQTK